MGATSCRFKSCHPHHLCSTKKLQNIKSTRSGRSCAFLLLNSVFCALCGIFEFESCILTCFSKNRTRTDDLIAIALTVRSSAKAKTIEEAQQRAVFLIFPILAPVIGQFTGIILISTWILLGLGAVLLILDVLLMKGVAKNFTYEKLLR